MKRGGFKLPLRTQSNVVNGVSRSILGVLDDPAVARPTYVLPDRTVEKEWQHPQPQLIMGVVMLDPDWLRLAIKHFDDADEEIPKWILDAADAQKFNIEALRKDKKGLERAVAKWEKYHPTPEPDITDQLFAAMERAGPNFSAMKAPMFGSAWDGQSRTGSQMLGEMVPYLRAGTFLVAGAWAIIPASVAAPAVLGMGSAGVGFDLASWLAENADLNRKQYGFELSKWQWQKSYTVERGLMAFGMGVGMGLGLMAPVAGPWLMAGMVGMGLGQGADNMAHGNYFSGTLDIGASLLAGSHLAKESGLFRTGEGPMPEVWEPGVRGRGLEAPGVGRGADMKPEGGRTKIGSTDDFYGRYGHDSEVRERMGEAVMDGFVRARADYEMPDDFGLHSREANAHVKAAITKYVFQASKLARLQGLKTFHDRLAAFQDESVQTSVPGNDYEEFFGHTRPEFYDEPGTVVRMN